MATGFSGQDLRASEETVSIKVLRQFIDMVETMGAHNAHVKNAFEEAPENRTRGRSFLQVAMDDLMDAYAYMAKDISDSERISMPFYLITARTRFGDDFKQSDATDRLTASIIQNASKDDQNLHMPEFIKLLHGRVPDEILQALTQNWDTCLNRIQRILTDEDSLTAEQNRIKLVTAFNAEYQGLNQEQAYNAQIKKEASEIGGNANDNLTPAKQTGTDIAPVDDATQKASIEALRNRMTGIRQQLKDLGAYGSNDLEAIEDTLESKNLPPEVAEKVRQELEVAHDMNPADPNVQKSKNYLKWVAKLPWDEFSDLETDINKSEHILDEGHYGMDAAKNAIIEHIAVEKRTGKSTGKILCLVGAPGVGKTSIGKSMSEATGREFVRIALGGVSNESKIRGHGRTYMDSRPGIIVDALRKAQTSNPLIMLDEIDKLRDGGHNGDPISAMLEVLDPEQNKAFRDHYLELDLDLSNVLFVATANNLAAIPAPLRDRMEIIEMPGYSHDEKIEIASRYLLPKQLAKNGLTDQDLSLSPEAIGKIVSGYTRELGVRNLEREIGKVCRKHATKIERNETVSKQIGEETLSEYLGPRIYTRKDVTSKGDLVGRVNGLAYSSVGGSIMRIEVTREAGNGLAIQITGNLRQVMTESIRVARGAVLQTAEELNLDPEKLMKSRLNVHALAGGTPKDGPSAGAAIATAMISSLTNIPIRSHVAMTGEISLHGDIMPIGGLPEKLDGAIQDGAKKVLIPEDNMIDLADVPDSILSQLEIVPVTSLAEVLEHALSEPIPAPEHKDTPETETNIEEKGQVDDEDAPKGDAPENDAPEDKDGAAPTFRSYRASGFGAPALKL